MSLILKIDNREQQLKQLFKECNYNIHYQNLEHGDFVFQYNDMPIIIIERKTLNDLAASLKDTRYRNQKINLLNNYEKKQIYYIIEGDLNYDTSDCTTYNGISKDALISCIINTMIRDDIKIFMTKNMLDTYNLLNNIAKRFNKDINKYISEPSIETSQLVVKKKNIVTKEDCFKNQLIQVPNISNKTALAIIKSYPTLSLFYATMSVKNNEEKKELLSDIYTTDSKNNKKKLSCKIVNNIIELMF